jgi:hypothetical protein
MISIDYANCKAPATTTKKGAKGPVKGAPKKALTTKKTSFFVYK